MGCDKILARLPYRVRKIADHLERSTESAGLNLSEGLTVYKPKVKASCFDIARREAGEIRKALRRLVRRKAVTPQAVLRADSLTSSFIGAMTKMIQQQEARESEGNY